jgi:hypothetical protein
MLSMAWWLLVALQPEWAIVVIVEREFQIQFGIFRLGSYRRSYELFIVAPLIVRCLEADVRRRERMLFFHDLTFFGTQRAKGGAKGRSLQPTKTFHPFFILSLKWPKIVFW